MVKTIGLISIKGGVGKTTLSAALASDLVKRHEARVLLVDANYSAPNLGLHMNILAPKKSVHDVLAGGENMKEAIHSRYGVDVIPGSFLFKRSYNPLKLRNKIASLKKNYDFVIIDSSPNLNDELLSTMVASDILFVVSTADYPTLSCSMKAAREAKLRGKPITGIILNKVRGKYEISLDEVQDSLGIPVVAKIKEDDIVHMALHERVPAPVFSRDAAFSREVGRLSDSIVGKKENNSLRKFFGLDLKKEQVNREVLRQSFYSSIFK